MWLLFGSGSIAAAIANLILTAKHKDPKWFRFLSLAFTALTVCAFYADAAQRVLQEDWAGLADTLPAVSRLLWFCVIGAIVLNGISLFIPKKA